MMLTNEKLKYTPSTDINELAVEIHTEISAIKIIDNDLNIMCIYRAPHGNTDLLVAQLVYR